MKFGGNIKNLLKQAGKMKEQMDKLQSEAGEKTVEASSGGGMVTVVAKAKGEIISIKIEPEIVQENDIEMLQDLITASINEALKRGQEIMKDEVSKMAGNLGIPPGLL
ncbi:MAG: YbaB/EbfC family nucleoid-associated protein [Thermodesulfobacteriota bacterium]